jgi:hypothetical protein
VEDHGRGFEGYLAVGNDAGIVPALTGVVVHEEHMVGEILAEAQLVRLGPEARGRRLGYLYLLNYIDFLSLEISDL